MRKYSEQERQEHIENWKKGTISKAAYAKSAGIEPTTFYTWTRGKTDTAGETGFIEITQKKIVGTTKEIIIEKKGVSVHVPLPTNKEELQNIFRALEGIR